MRNSLLISILKDFKKEDLDHLEDFLNAPFHNTNPRYTQLYQYVRTYYPTFEAKELDKEVVFPVFFPPDKYKTQAKDPYKLLRTLTSHLTRLVEDFLAITAFKKDKLAQKKALIQAYARLGHAKQFQDESNKLIKTLKKNKQSSSVVDLELFFAYKDQFCHPELLTKTKFQSMFPLIQTATKHVQQYYTSYILWQRVEQLNSARIHQLEEDIAPLNSLLPNSIDIENEDNLHIKLYYQLNQLLEQEQDDELFEKIWASFQQHYANISTEDQRIIFTKLLNYCKYRHKKEKNFIHQVLVLHQFSLRQQLILEKGKLRFSHFLSITMSACMCQETEWANVFIQQYRHQIAPKAVQKNVFTIAKGFIYFYENNFEDARLCLYQQSELSHVGFDFVIKSISLRTEYELWQRQKDYETLKESTPVTRNFYRFLQGKTKVKATIKAPYFILIKLIHDLINLKIKAKEKGKKHSSFIKQKEKLQLKVVAYPFFATDWVLEKLEQI